MKSAGDGSPSAHLFSFTNMFTQSRCSSASWFKEVLIKAKRSWPLNAIATCCPTTADRYRPDPSCCGGNALLLRESFIFVKVVAFYCISEFWAECLSSNSQGPLRRIQNSGKGRQQKCKNRPPYCHQRALLWSALASRHHNRSLINNITDLHMLKTYTYPWWYFWS